MKTTSRIKSAGVPEGSERSQCANCDWIGYPSVTTENIPDLNERTDPGGTVPSGECNECHCLCYPYKPRKKRTRQPDAQSIYRRP